MFWANRQNILAEAIDNSWTVQELLHYLTTKSGKVVYDLKVELMTDPTVKRYPTLSIDEYLLIKQYEL